MSGVVLFDHRPEGVPLPAANPLVDGTGRTVTYLRLSVTDRCDLRCSYCMPKRMHFLPKSELLSLAELQCIADHFIARGVGTVRITGGEPLVRRNVGLLLQSLGRHLRNGRLGELTLTTNGTQLARRAGSLANAGVRRINVSLDTVDPDLYRELTRGGDLARVMEGLRAACVAGLRVKINAVALAANRAHLLPLVLWAHGEGHDVTLIEAMPLGDAGGDRKSGFVDLGDVKTDLSETLTLTPSTHRTAGPSRYFDVRETGGRVGFITPLSSHFCATCNRVRLTCTGQLYTCLGHGGAADLRDVLRSGGDLDAAIDNALSRKPERHDFSAARPGKLATARHMSVTGG